MNERTDLERLQLVLRANATTSGLGGIAGLVGAGFFSDWMGVDNVMLVAVVSAGLIAFAAVVWLAASTDEQSIDLTPWISTGDMIWVVATTAIVLSDALTTGGNILAVVIGVMVLDFACLQVWFRHRATQPTVAIART